MSSNQSLESEKLLALAEQYASSADAQYDPQPSTRRRLTLVAWISRLLVVAMIGGVGTWCYLNRQQLIENTTSQINLGEWVTGQTWEERQAANGNKFGPFDEVFYPDDARKAQRQFEIGFAEQIERKQKEQQQFQFSLADQMERRQKEMLRKIPDLDIHNQNNRPRRR